MDGNAIDHKVTYLLRLLDRDHDGVLLVSDFENWVDRLSALRGWEPGTPGYEALRTVFVDDGFIALMAAAGPAAGRAELNTARAILVAMSHGDAPEIALWAKTLFDLLDAERRGTIGREEYRDLLASVCVDRAAADEAFARIDTGGTGRISAERFTELYVGYFLSDDLESPASWFWGPVLAPARNVTAISGARESRDADRRDRHPPDAAGAPGTTSPTSA